MFGVGLLGEYVGRIYQQVRTRPSYVIRAVLERNVERIIERDAQHDGEPKGERPLGPPDARELEHAPRGDDR
ncbi:MAG TPA: hypothetical protein VKT00_05980, partial [Casimicrobiaceae bacterium]|nr:hypothetical protein [Casimicrobiaceae bacterium]